MDRSPIRLAFESGGGPSSRSSTFSNEVGERSEVCGKVAEVVAGESDMVNILIRVVGRVTIDIEGEVYV
jgi:hypothetical protein